MRDNTIIFSKPIKPTQTNLVNITIIIKFYYFMEYFVCYFSRIFTDYVFVLWWLIYFQVNITLPEDGNR